MVDNSTQKKYSSVLDINSLRIKMFIGFFFITLVFILFALYFYNQNRSSLIKAENQALLTVATQTAERIDNFILNNLIDINSHATLPSIVTYLNLQPNERNGSPQEVIVLQTLESLATYTEHAGIISYAILDAQGKNVIDTLNVGQNESGQDYFRKPIETGEPYVSDVTIVESLDGGYIYFSSPVYNESHEMIGVLRMQSDITAIQDLVHQSHGIMGEKSFAFLLNKDYIFLSADEQKNLLFKSIKDLPTDFSSFVLGLENADKQPFFIAKANDIENTMSQMAVAKLNTRSWFVVFSQSQDVFLTAVQDESQSSITVSLLIIGVVILLAVMITQFIVNPIARLTTSIQNVVHNNFTGQIFVETKDEIGKIANTFNQMIVRTNEHISSLESKLKERIADLQISLEVGQRASAIKDLDQLFLTVTELIHKRFDLYSTKIFLIDDDQESLVLKAKAGNTNEAYQLISIDDDFMVNHVIAKRDPIVVSDTTQSNLYKDTQLLPDIRSQLAIPLIVQREIIGVLDMCSTLVNDFNEDNLPGFEAMATQLAISIDSAKQWSLNQEAQQQLREVIKRFTLEGWADRLASSSQKGRLSFTYNPNDRAPTETDLAQMYNAQHESAVPISVQSENIGHVAIVKDNNDKLSQDERTLLETVTKQLAQKVENLRLFEQTQQRAAREQLAREIADRMHDTPDVGAIIQTSLTELAKALKVSQIYVTLMTGDDKK
ncbi:MAG: hypothetical protein B6242_10305 [Anaerolineaceae bacterium 4572_78]|nr:MAG: hypothetical protein B6242_10305 [Anaerolineaceae bacterium 4572_78]